MKRFALAAAIVLWPAAALADGGEGAACTITADCGSDLRCIDETCVAISNGKLVAPIIVQRERSAGERAWISDGKGYVTEVVVGDIVATVTAGALVAAALGTGQGWLAFAALFPTTLTGPIIHGANGRGGPAVVSFFAWAAVPPTLTFFAFLVAVATDFGDTNGEGFAIAGYAIGIGAAAGLTALDAYFARTVGPRRPVVESSLSIIPTVVPFHGGFTAGVAGSF
ncbi:MAG TPA: hypothetical protein VH054_04910 [Polyangiaceae bacterium]|nr:hypothetical protein [Polyangiaceae bacterium]